jgi:uncharacterized OB-fold protein
MKELFKWLACIIKRRHTWEYFKKRKMQFHQYFKKRGGKIAKCEHCGRIVFFPMKNKHQERSI